MALFFVTEAVTYSVCTLHFSASEKPPSGRIRCGIRFNLVGHLFPKILFPDTLLPLLP
jgi:hypothetical protein